MYWLKTWMRLCSENIAVLLSSSFIAMFAQFQFLPHKMALRPLKTIMTCCILLLLIMMNEWWWRWWEQKWRKTLGQTDFRHTENIRSSCCNNIYTSRQNNLNYWLAHSSIHENGFFSTQSKYIHSFFFFKKDQHQPKRVNHREKWKQNCWYHLSTLLAVQIIWISNSVDFYSWFWKI